MANTPEGTPYVESSDLVANYPAASLALANRVDLVGVLPFANAAARTTAIPTPTDGQFTYLQDTNSTEFYDGANFVPVGTPPGLVHINTTAVSAQSTVSINNVFTSTYQNYLIITNLKAASSYANDILLRFRASGSDESGSIYQRQKLEVFATSVSASRQQNQTSSTIGYLSNDTEYALQAIVGSPQLTKPTSLFHNGNNSDGSAIVTNPVLYFAGNLLNNSTAYDGFTIFSVGAVNFSGNVRVYGYKNS